MKRREKQLKSRLQKHFKVLEEYERSKLFNLPLREDKIKE